jgi:hypothetical protein
METTMALGDYLRERLRGKRKEPQFSAFSVPMNPLRPPAGCFPSQQIAPGKEPVFDYDDLLAPGWPRDGNSQRAYLPGGWLEGLSADRRHGFFSCYEAFIRSGFHGQQHAQWLNPPGKSHGAGQSLP